MNNLLELLEAKQELDSMIESKIDQLGLSESFVSNMLSKRGNTTQPAIYNHNNGPAKMMKMPNTVRNGMSSLLDKGKMALCNFRYGNNPKMLSICQSRIQKV